MIVYYRLCDIKSELSQKSPILSDNLYELNKLCLKSFVEAFKDVENLKVVFICDYCPEKKYKRMIEAYVPFRKDIYFTQRGINETCLLQYVMAKEVEGTILFQECDYLYRPNTGVLLEKAINHFGLVSPYDHRNYYIDRSIHSKKCEIELFDNHHFRTTERNTMTFGMTSEVFRKNYESLVRWGYLDGDVWKELKVNGSTLWVPIPSMATHMVKDFMAPGVAWEELYAS